MASITDVARMAGVSITTASRVLNPVPGYPIAAVTRQRVLAAAESLEYSPSAIARALVTRRSRIVGVLVGDIVDPYFAEIVRGVEDVARRAGYMVVVCNTDRDPATELRYVAALRDYRADGLLFLGGDFYGEAERAQLADELVQARRHGTIALAVLGGRGDLPALDIDHRAAARETAEYLIALGHERIGFIAGDGAVSTARQRLEGFQDAMAAAGLAADLVDEGLHTYAGGQAAAFRLLARRPTALFAGNDEMAIGAMAAARAVGLAVPEQLSVVGFGDTARARQSAPTLTTASIPRHEIGAAAMETIADALGPAHAAVCSRTFRYGLVLRESSGPPRRVAARLRQVRAV